MSDPEEDQSTMKFLRNAETLLVAVILAIILWVGQTTYSNSLALTKLATQVEILVTVQTSEIQDLRNDIGRIDQHLNTIWPRLREFKERIQMLESESGKPRNPWKD